MKKILLLSALFLTVQGYSKAIPGPSVLFSISEKILTEAHQFVFSTEKEMPKATVKVKPEVKTKVKTTVKKQDKSLWDLSLQVRREGMWIIAE
jgi:hypothetical protein